MAIIVFTRLERDIGVIRRYGQFSFIATKKGAMIIDGFMRVSQAMHGDKEVVVMTEETRACIAEATALKVSGDETRWLQTGRGVHPKAGPFVAFKAPGFVVKITGKNTEIDARDCSVPSLEAANEILAMFESMNVLREEIRIEYRAWARESV